MIVTQPPPGPISNQTLHHAVIQLTCSDDLFSRRLRFVIGNIGQSNDAKFHIHPAPERKLTSIDDKFIRMIRSEIAPLMKSALRTEKNILIW